MGVFQRHFRLILRTHAALDHAVDPAALLHGILRGTLSPVIDVATAQNELHQIPDRYSDFSCHAASPPLTNSYHNRMPAACSGLHTLTCPVYENSPGK